MRRTTLVTAWLLAAQLAVIGTAVAGETVDALGVLRRVLDQNGSNDEGKISAKSTARSRVISYCPDNTCEVFAAPLSMPEPALADFAFTYLFYASGYYYLRGFVIDAGKPSSQVILARNRGSCSGSDETMLASCVLQSLARRYNVRVSSVRHDEGARRESPIDLSKEVAVEQLKRTRAWQLEQWRGHP